MSLAIGGGLISIGGGAMVAGEALAATGAVATVTSGGTASPVSVPVAGAGVTLTEVGAVAAGAGVLMMGNASQNQSKGYERGKSGRGTNHLKPSQEATGDHSTFRTGSDGKITNTATYKVNTKNPTGFDEVKRVDIKGGSHKNKEGIEISTPHVHEGKNVRPARNDELPNNR